MKLTLEDNNYKVSRKFSEDLEPISRSVSWNDHTDTPSLANDIPMIFEYLKQYQRRLKAQVDCSYYSNKMIPQSKVEHIDKLLERYKKLYTKSWEWDGGL